MLTTPSALRAVASQNDSEQNSKTFGPIDLSSLQAMMPMLGSFPREIESVWHANALVCRTWPSGEAEVLSPRHALRHGLTSQDSDG
jgi:hypothetical protein